MTAADTGLPLRRAEVRVSGGDLRSMRVASTDADGRFEVQGLPAGRYSVSARQDGFVMGDFAPQSRGVAPRPPLEVKDGALVEHVDIALRRGAVAAGRVVDEAGEPMEGVTVSALRKEAAPAPFGVMAVGTAETNDLGEFRIFGLDAGSYIVSASWRGLPIPGLDDPPGYALTYFPGTADLDGATSVALAASQRVDGLVLAMIPARTSRVSGTAIDVAGAPVTQGNVFAFPSDLNSGMSSMTMAQLRPDGTFTLEPCSRETTS